MTQQKDNLLIELMFFLQVVCKVILSSAPVSWLGYNVLNFVATQES